MAKKNSLLMTKIADLETRVSDLIQQNIELRALNAKNEDQKRKWLEDKLSVIENGVTQRFEEMFQIFSTIRHNEGLGASNVSTRQVIANVSHDSSEKTVSFQTVKSPKLSTKERRRKSTRRESMYIAPPEQMSPEKVETEEPIQVYFNDTNPFDEVSNPEASENPLIPEELEDSMDQASSLSPIKISTSSPDISRVSCKKFEVYEDMPDVEEIRPTKEMLDKIQKLAEGSVHEKEQPTLGKVLDDEISDQYKPLEEGSKIKRKIKGNFSSDEKMPASSDVLSTRKSRTRGKQVSYAEPSLRVKMRRQSEKFVDAIVEDVLVRPASRGSFVADDDVELTKHQEPPEPLATEMKKLPGPLAIEVKNAESKQVDTVDESPVKHKPLTEQDNVNITKRRRPLTSLSQNKMIRVENDKLPTKKRFNLSDDELSVFDLVEESAVGVPKTYKKPEIKKKGRRHSMLS